MYTVQEILDLPDREKKRLYSGEEYNLLKTLKEKNALEQDIVDDTLRKILDMSEEELYESLKEKGLYKRNMTRGEAIVTVHGYLTFPLTAMPKDILEFIINQGGNAAKFALAHTSSATREFTKKHIRDCDSLTKAAEDGDWKVYKWGIEERNCEITKKHLKIAALNGEI